MKVSKMKKVEMKWRLMKSGGEKRVRSDEKSNEVQNLQLSVPVEVVGQKLYLDIKAVIHRISWNQKVSMVGKIQNKHDVILWV